MTTFADLGLSAKTLAAVEALGYTEPTPVQEQSIPLALEGRDVIAAAKTGTGKTAAFSLPCMDTLPHRAKHESGPFMLVITPTRELASQIADTCMPIGKHTNHFIGVFLGGVSYDPQIRKLQRGIDVAIATPGRLIDLMERGAIDLSAVQVLVLDEADRMLDMGFWPQVERIVEATPETRQTLLFSATIDRSQDKTMFSILNDPAIVEISQRGETADKVDQYIISTNRREKPELLNSFIKKNEGDRVIVFTKTKGGADNCCRRLRRIGIPTEAIHADRSQAQRSRALDGFRNGRVNVLVATDVLARGIDVTEVDYVVNYDLPIMPEDYVHRIGRTGRAGESGFAVSFVTPDTKNLLRGIQKFIGRTIEEMPFEIGDDAFEPIDNADPRMVAQALREIELKHGSKVGKDADKSPRKKKGKLRQRDIDRVIERQAKAEAEAAGVEYVPVERPKAPRKPTLEERQAKAEEAFNAMFSIGNLPDEEGGKKKRRGDKDGKGKKGEGAKGKKDRKGSEKSKKAAPHTFAYDRFDKSAIKESKAKRDNAPFIDEEPRAQRKPARYSRPNNGVLDNGRDFSKFNKGGKRKDGYGRDDRKGGYGKSSYGKRDGASFSEGRRSAEGGRKNAVKEAGRKGEFGRDDRRGGYGKGPKGDRPGKSGSLGSYRKASGKGVAAKFEGHDRAEKSYGKGGSKGGYGKNGSRSGYQTSGKGKGGRPGGKQGGYKPGRANYGNAYKRG